MQSKLKNLPIRPQLSSTDLHAAVLARLGADADQALRGQAVHSFFISMAFSHVAQSQANWTVVQGTAMSMQMVEALERAIAYIQEGFDLLPPHLEKQYLCRRTTWPPPDPG